MGLLLSSGFSAVLVAKPEGWLLLAPRFGKETLLLDTQGKLRHTWKSEANNGGGARLLSDGAVLRVIDMAKEKTFQKVGLVGGGLEILEWDGSLRWRFWNAVTHTMGVADAVQLPNGNILMAALEWLSPEEALEAGRPPEAVDPFGLLVPALMEYRPKGESAGIPVWKWSLKHHLFQKREPSLARHHPEGLLGCVDIGEPSDSKGRRWLMPRQVSYHPGEDLIVLTVSGLGEAWVIDHSTSEVEAASDGGGKRGKGGRILMRLRNPTDDSPEHFGGGILAADWHGEGQGSPPQIELMSFRDGNYHYVTSSFNAELAASNWDTLFTWVSDSAIQTSAPQAFSPSLILPVETDWLLLSSATGVIRRLDPSRRSLWEFRCESGLRNFRMRPTVKVGTEGAPQKLTEKTAIRSMAPIESLRHYPGSMISIQVPEPKR